jgi:linoleoyl-CoA desaturase
VSSTVRVTFANREQQFVDELKRRVNEYFESRQLSQKANAAMVVKTVTILAVTFGAYGLIMSGGFTPLQMWGLAAIMGVGLAGMGFSISHDALHGAYSHNPKINQLLGYTFDIAGANGYLWKITHNVIHHTYTNIHGIDEDLTVSPLLRLSPESEWKPVHRWQHVYGWLAYSFSTIFWVFVKDYKYFFQKDIGPYKDKKHPRSEWITLWVTKAFYYSWALILPLLVIDVPLWQFAVGFFTMHMVAGTILGVVFQLAHVVEETEHPLPDEKGKMESAWLVHEMETTSNFGRSNRLLCWYVGGLNFQIEHHLFPKVCSIHYPAISPIVEETAKKYGIPYNQHRTLREAIASHYRMIRMLGQGRAGAAARQEPLAA